jgi:protein-disulfide isomerase
LVHFPIRKASARLLLVIALASLPLSLSCAQQAEAAGPTVFPNPDPENFTALSPSKETIDGFLRASWGFDENRIWQIQAIQKTTVAGLTKVVVLIGDKTGAKHKTSIQFYVLPDGKHIIAGDEVILFGEHPFAEPRALLQSRADGPYRGAAAKDLEIVEFCDFQSPHCRDARTNMDRLAADYPSARIVYQNFPLARIHPQAMTAAAYGVCVAKIAGNSAFFQFASAIYDDMDRLRDPDGLIPALNGALAKAGVAPEKIAACATTPAARASVGASVKLAEELGLDQIPTLFVNGRQVPGNAPYETLKQAVDYQIKLDGLN